LHRPRRDVRPDALVAPSLRQPSVSSRELVRPPIAMRVFGDRHAAFSVIAMPRFRWSPSRVFGDRDHACPAVTRAFTSARASSRSTRSTNILWGARTCLLAPVADFKPRWHSLWSLRLSRRWPRHLARNNCRTTMVDYIVDESAVDTPYRSLIALL